MEDAMGKNLLFILCYLCFMIFVQILFADQSLANDKNVLSVAIPDSQVATLKKNIAMLDPFTVTWTQKRTSQMDIDAFIKRVNAGPGLLTFFEPEYNVYMWQNGSAFLYSAKQQIEMDNTPKTDKNGKMVDKITKNDYQMHREGLTTAMDTQNYYIGRSEKDTENPKSLSVFPISKTMENDSTYPVFLQSYLPFVGGWFPTYGYEIKSSPKSFILFLIETGKLVNFSEVIFDNEKTFRIDVESRSPLMDINDGLHVFSFWLIPKYNLAVKRIEVKSSNGQLVLCASNDDFMRLPGKEVYIPRKTLVNYYSLGNVSYAISDGPLYSQEFTLSECSIKTIRLSQFDIRKKFQTSGVIVSDRSLRDTDEGHTFFIPANPADLDRVIEAALTGGDFVPTPLPSTAAIIVRWLLCITGIAMILYACYIKFLKKSNK
jgi:hypothetical protein